MDPAHFDVAPEIAAPTSGIEIEPGLVSPRGQALDRSVSVFGRDQHIWIAEWPQCDISVQCDSRGWALYRKRCKPRRVQVLDNGKQFGRRREVLDGDRPCLSDQRIQDLWWARSCPTLGER